MVGIKVGFAKDGRITASICSPSCDNGPYEQQFDIGERPA